MADITDINVNGTSYNIRDDEGMRYVSSPTNGDVLTTDANGQAVDSGVALSSLATASDVSAKQDTLVSGTNIKTVNSTSLLGSGNIAVQPVLTAGNGISISNNVITNAFTYLNAEDLNDLSTFFVGYAYNCTNRPSGASAFGTLISLVGAGRRSQLYTNLYNGKIYTRKYYGSTWSAWAEVVTSYVAGDTVTLSTWFEAHGLCGSTATTLYFTLPLSKPVDASVTSVSFTSLTISVYSNGTRTVHNVSITGGSYGLTATLDKSINAIGVTITGLPTMTKNTPVAVEVVSGASFKFS